MTALLDASGAPVQSGPVLPGEDVTLFDPAGQKLNTLPHVAVLVPALDGDTVTAGFACSLAEMMQFTIRGYPEMSLGLVMDRDRSPMAARTRLAEAALAGGATHLLWLDPSVRFPKWALLHGLGVLQGTGLPLIAANYTGRELPLLPEAYAGPKERAYTYDGVERFQPVPAVGLGWVLMTAEGLRAVERPWFAEPYDPKTGQYLPHEMWFGIQWAKVHGPLFLDHGLSSYIGRDGWITFTHEHAVSQRDALQAEASHLDTVSGEAPAVPS